MKKLIIPVTACLALAACGSDQPSEVDPTTDISAVDFGNDNGDWANDDECDDPRFEGPGMTATPLLDEDIGHDASDCRAAYEAGELQLVSEG